ncbi:GGDEF domain-containing protein [Anaerotignum sp.]|uniref:GGDEF domain-containing protein n=1 Tax=Anaerotignum sp. TaxID=2039241 RepID=UPI0033302C63
MNTGIAEMNLLASILFLLLFFYGKTAVPKQNNHKFLYSVLCFTIIALTADTALLFIKATASQGARLSHYTLLFIHAVATVASGYYWLIFTHNETLPEMQCQPTVRMAYTLPLLVWILIAFCSPYNHWIYVVDVQNAFSPGSFFYLQDIFIYGYIFASGLLAFTRYYTETILEQQKLCLHLFIYSMIPLFGKCVEVVFPRLQIAVPAVVISIVMLYLSNMKNELFLDPLTKLYNRRQFQLHLAQNTKLSSQGNIFLIFFDINNFKTINDKFGHVEGDKALIMVAQVLKAVFSDSKAFLSRYGGDEFAVILSKEEQEVLSYLKQIDLSLIDISKALPYHLSLSAGYSIYGQDDATTLEGLVQAADRKMYCDKQEKKNSLC